MGASERERKATTKKIRHSKKKKKRNERQPASQTDNREVF